MVTFGTYAHGVQRLAGVAVTFQLDYTSCSTTDFNNKYIIVTNTHITGKLTSSTFRAYRGLHALQGFGFPGVVLSRPRHWIKAPSHP
eukprot:469372-Ditylum_brightwellii.AAC.1